MLPIRTPVVAAAGPDFSITCIDNPNGKQIGEAPQTGFTYSWTPTTGLSAANVSNPTANPSTTTTYTVTKTRTADNCSDTDQVTVTVNNAAVTAYAGEDFTKTCTTNASGKQIGEASDAAFTYSWVPAAGLSATNISNPIANPTEPTTYTVTKTNLSSGCSDTDQIVVDVDITPSGIPGGVDVDRCGPGSVTLAVESPLNGVTYKWYDVASGGTALTPEGPTYNTGNLTATKSFWVSATSANGCESSRTEIVAIIRTPATADAGGDLTACQSATPSAITLSGADVGGGATTGAWSIISGGGTLSSTAQTANPETVTYTPAANYSGPVVLRLTTNNPDGACPAVYDERTINIGTAATAEAGAQLYACQSGSPSAITLAGASVGGGATTGAWSIISGGGTLSSTAQTASPATVTYTPAANFYGTVTLRLTTNDPAGDCIAATDDRIITINQAVIAEAGGNITRCQSTSEQIIALTGASVTGGATTGTWSITSATPAAGVTLTNNTVASGSLTIAANYTGVINLTLTSADPDGAGPCVADTDTRTVTIGPAAVVDAGNPITRCQSATSQAIALTGASITGGASTGTWTILSSVPANAGNVLSNNTYASGSLTVAANYYGVITLQLTSADPDGAGPCQAAVDTRTVTIYQNPTVMVSAGTSTCINNVPTVTITATPSGGSGTGYMYDWTVPMGAVDPGNVASFNATVAGTYSVIVTDSRTCSGSGSVVPLFVPCEMLEGCTPGYWKQSQHFGNWGCNYVPTGTNATLFSTALGLTSAQMTLRGLPTNLTLLQALNLNGGKFYALARHAAAAILNSCADVNYKYTAAQIRTMVKTAFTSGNWSTAHNNLSAANEMGCPLGRAPLATTSKTNGLKGIETTTDQITAYPTPFSDRAIVEFRMAADEDYVVNLYDMKGSLVKQLKAGSAKAGELQQVEVNGKGLGEGLYIARMISDSGARSVKLLLKRE
ncbi:hypothetical protein [Pontibacter populi]|uniref:Ig-like domain-containing protein n=1 Tax=Pontibacter populi TaxID=890055 RepID=A0ABV1RPZ6_9BACT